MLDKIRREIDIFADLLLISLFIAAGIYAIVELMVATFGGR